MLNVVCFLWNGDRWDDFAAFEHGPEYVRRLARAVRRNLATPHQFFCFTNIDFRAKDDLDGYLQFKNLQPPSWKGCLPKLFAFSRRSGFKEGDQILSLDIDIVITGSLDDMASYDGPLCVRSKFKPGEEYKADGDIVGFVWSEKNRNEIWKPLLDAPRAAERSTGGRERWWFRQKAECKDRWQDLFPGQIVSYKRHVRTNKNKLPEGVRVVSCHGRPRPHEMEDLEWVRTNWK